MNLRQRWWAASTLLFLAAAGAQRARAAEVAMEPVERPRQTSQQAETDVGIVLTRPISRTTIAQLLSDAEAAYRRGDLDEATDTFKSVTVLEPANSIAWLRMGNLHQRAGLDEQALSAYWRAVRPFPDADASPSDPRQREAVAKSWLNIALLNISRASRAIDALDQLELSSFNTPRQDVARQVGAQRHRAYRSARRAFDIDTPPPSIGNLLPAQPVSSTEAQSLQPATEPYTVDRWVHLPRRRAITRGSGQASVTEPLTEDPLPPSPVIEQLQGVPASSVDSSPRRRAR